MTRGCHDDELWQRNDIANYSLNTKCYDEIGLEKSCENTGMYFDVWFVFCLYMISNLSFPEEKSTNEEYKKQPWLF